jgi:hypothetical protein
MAIPPGAHPRLRGEWKAPGDARKTQRALCKPVYCCEHRASTEVETTMETVKIEHHSLSGGLWFAAWLFTLGYLELGFFKGVLAILLWPYYLGQAFGG